MGGGMTAEAVAAGATEAPEKPVEVEATGEKRVAETEADDAPLAKKEKKEGKEGKEKKEKKEGKEGKEKKDKKDKKEKKEKKAMLAKRTSTGSLELSSELDQRKLFKEGQRNVTPPVADPTRAFYTSLLAENPESKIAIRFCIEYGVLSFEEHTKLLKKYNTLKDKGAFSMAQQIKKALEKKLNKKLAGGKEKKDKKDKKDKKG